MEHLTYFKVENFKRFESFEMDDIGQFNLIVGDNNVGKTSVLEALLFDEDSEVLSKNLSFVFDEKFAQSVKKEDYLQYFLNKKNSRLRMDFSFKKKGNEKEERIELQYSASKKSWYLFHIKTVTTKRRSDIVELIFDSEDHISFIPISTGYRSDLTDYYASIQESRELKRSLIESLRVLIPSVDDIELSARRPDPILLIAQRNMDAVLPLAFFGEGAIKLFRILCEVVVTKGKRLMIDEIDAGIHFSRMKLFWKTILKAAKDNEVQLFITTHNEECLRYFKEALEEDDMQSMQKEARCFTLQEVKDGNVKAYKTGFEGFQHAIDMNINIRGGKIYG